MGYNEEKSQNLQKIIQNSHVPSHALNFLKAMEDPQGLKQKFIGNFSSQPYKKILNSPLNPKTLYMRQIKD